MKMVKSLLLVSAAGLVASAGAQAADLPVKAKPVEYVKVCSLYGAGFYYIPGTDICLKLYGYVRYQARLRHGQHHGRSVRRRQHQQQPSWRRRTSARARTIIGIDTRQQTAYGTLRAYMNVGFTKDTNANAGYVATAGIATPMYANRAFIQLAGFTWVWQRPTSTSCRRRPLPTTQASRMPRTPATVASLLPLTRPHWATAFRRACRSSRAAETTPPTSTPQHYAVPTTGLSGDNLSPNITTFAVTLVRTTTPATCLTLSATSASTRLGVRHSSPVPCITSALATTLHSGGMLQRCIVGGQRSSQRQVGLGDQPGSEDQLPDDRTWRLLPGRFRTTLKAPSGMRRTRRSVVVALGYYVG